MERESITEQILKSLLIPDNTRMEGNNIFVEGDVIIGNHSRIEYGITGNSVVMGEGVNIEGDVIARADARIDMWSRIGSSVKVEKNAYLGEFVAIDGKLTVQGDLDVGKDVKIKGGFEAKGWIVVRNPVPVILFVYLYIMEMMRLGKGEEVEKALEELFEDSEDKLKIGEKVLIVPPNAAISGVSLKVPGKAVIGDKCTLTGNLVATSVAAGKNLNLHGDIRSEGEITLGENTIIHGNIFAKGKVSIPENTCIFGEIQANSVSLHESSKVHGLIKAPLGVSFMQAAKDEAEKAVNASETEKQDGKNEKEAAKAADVPETEFIFSMEQTLKQSGYSWPMESFSPEKGTALPEERIGSEGAGIEESALKRKRNFKKIHAFRRRQKFRREGRFKKSGK